MKKLGLLALIVSATFGPALAEGPPAVPPRQKVLGIGGLFFKSDHPDSLAQWYEKNLGIAVVPTSAGQQSWRQEAGDTAFAPFPRDSKYFGKPEQSWMVDFRVADLKAMVAQLRTAGITVGDIESYSYGDFAHLHDPEGNPIELWEPKPPK